MATKRKAHLGAAPKAHEKQAHSAMSMVRKVAKRAIKAVRKGHCKDALLDYGFVEAHFAVAQREMRHAGVKRLYAFNTRGRQLKSTVYQAVAKRCLVPGRR